MSTLRRFGTTLAGSVERFWRHGDLFPAAAISFYALFSMLPLAILLLIGLQIIFPADVVARNMGRLFGGLTDTDILLRTLRDALGQQRTAGWFEAGTLVVAAAGVFAGVSVALNRVWEVPGRRFHLQFLIGIVMMATALLLFIATLLLMVAFLRLLRFSEIGALLGRPRLPSTGPLSALSLANALAQFTVFWVAYKLLPNVRIRWRDAWPGALVATVLWHIVGIGIGWYIAVIADYRVLYHQIQTVIALLVWVYALSCCFLFGAEFVAQWTPYPHVVREATRRLAVVEPELRHETESPSAGDTPAMRRAGSARR